MIEVAQLWIGVLPGEVLDVEGSYAVLVYFRDCAMDLECSCATTPSSLSRRRLTIRPVSARRGQGAHNNVSSPPFFLSLPNAISPSINPIFIHQTIL